MIRRMQEDFELWKLAWSLGRLERSAVCQVDSAIFAAAGDQFLVDRDGSYVLTYVEIQASLLLPVSI